MADDGGIGRLQKRFAALPRAVREGVHPALLKSGNEMASTMRQVAPDDPATGAPDLKSSIEVTGPGVAVTVGNADVRYPHLVEYGTTKAPAQPFFWTTVRLLQKRSANRIKRAIGKAVRNNWGKS